MDTGKRSAILHTRITPELEERLEVDRKALGQSITVHTQRTLEAGLSQSPAGVDRERAALQPS